MVDGHAGNAPCRQARTDTELIRQSQRHRKRQKASKSVYVYVQAYACAPVGISQPPSVSLSLCLPAKGSDTEDLFTIKCH
jgi:hypothetical protein